MRIGMVRVHGPSMAPALSSGDRLVVLWGAAARPGAVVVGRFRERPDLLVVKRAVSPYDGGWLLASDNPFAAGPSGVGDVDGRVLLRLWPSPRRRL
jgi:phage repressor protein C with HTH and peptisase S24 domain